MPALVPIGQHALKGTGLKSSQPWHLLEQRVGAQACPCSRSIGWVVGGKTAAGASEDWDGCELEVGPLSPSESWERALRVGTSTGPLGRAVGGSSGSPVGAIITGKGKVLGVQSPVAEAAIHKGMQIADYRLHCVYRRWRAQPGKGNDRGPPGGGTPCGDLGKSIADWAAGSTGPQGGKAVQGSRAQRGAVGWGWPLRALGCCGGTHRYSSKHCEPIAGCWRPSWCPFSGHPAAV